MDEPGLGETVSAKKSRLGDIENMEGHVDSHGEKSIQADSDPANIQMLQSEIRYWKRQTFLRQKIIDEHKQFTLERAQVTQSAGSSRLDQIFGTCVLPDVVIKEILKKIQDQQTLLNCRLVCVKWNQFIKDSQLMTRIKFPVWHAKPFLELPIVKQGDVKSISLRNCSLLQYERDFIDLISNSIEKVEFAFESKTLSAETAEPIFELIFEKCPKLQEITWRRGSLDLLRYCTIIRRQLATANQIRIVTIYAWNCLEVDDNSLIEFLMFLPNLKRIKLLGSLISSTVMSGLCEYINKYGSASQLKELSLEFMSFEKENSIEHQIFSELLLLCDRHKVQLEELPQVIFNHLLSSTNSIRSRMPRAALGRGPSPMYQAKLSGHLVFKGPKVTNLDRLSCLNIGELRLYFKRDLMNGELSWIKHVYAIDSLILSDDIEPEGTKLSQPSIEEFQTAFSAAIPSLKTLTIKTDILDLIVFRFRWSQYFPNVTKLEFDGCGNIPENFVSDLTGCEYLTCLELATIPNLMDDAFTAESINKLADNIGDGGNSLIAPAITCFKSLKSLTLFDCPGVTDACVINGISKSKTLETLNIYNCKGMSEICINLSKFKVDFDNSDLD